MKKILYTIFAAFIMPIVLLGAIIYLILYLLQLLFRTILTFLDMAMDWVDKNITVNIKE